MNKYLTGLIVAIFFFTSIPTQLESAEIQIDNHYTVYLGTEEEQIKQYANDTINNKWGITEWSSFDEIIKGESGWNFLAANSTSSARGLCQTMMSLYEDDVDDDFLTNPYKQIDWCVQYIDGRYGTPKVAWQFKKCLGWCTNPHTGHTTFKEEQWF